MKALSNMLDGIYTFEELVLNQTAIGYCANLKNCIDKVPSRSFSTACCANVACEFCLVRALAQCC